jgi:hypothetical protein
MVRFFLPRCADQSTLCELDDMASDAEKWRYAHALFSRIREKTLRADAAKDLLLQHQYSFEEICAKTLYNMSGHMPGQEFPYPFDNDSQFWDPDCGRVRPGAGCRGPVQRLVAPAPPQRGSAEIVIGAAEGPNNAIQRTRYAGR